MKKNNNNNNTILILVAVLILAAIAIFGVMKYQQVSSLNQGTSTQKVDDAREGGSPDEHVDKPGESK